ncbi:hypothetical protein HKX48_004537 [Thoreauomyces humboldtii]|nr:hypothetical protein HKX48_004537 [Thoreauomyces humboldtii]
MRSLIAIAAVSGLVVTVVAIALEFIKNQDWFEEQHGHGHEHSHPQRSQRSQTVQERMIQREQERKNEQDRMREEHARQVVEQQNGFGVEDPTTLRRRKQGTHPPAGSSAPTSTGQQATQARDVSPHSLPDIPSPQEPSTDLIDLTNGPAPVPAILSSNASDAGSETASAIAEDVRTLKQDLLARRALLQQKLSQLGWTEEQVRGLVPDEILMEEMDVPTSATLAESARGEVASGVSAPVSSSFDVADVFSDLATSPSPASFPMSTLQVDRIATHSDQETFDVQSFASMPPTLLMPASLNRFDQDDENEVIEASPSVIGTELSFVHEDGAASVHSMDSSWSTVDAPPAGFDGSH